MPRSIVRAEGNNNEDSISARVVARRYGGAAGDRRGDIQSRFRDRDSRIGGYATTFARCIRSKQEETSAACRGRRADRRRNGDWQNQDEDRVDRGVLRSQQGPIFPDRQSAGYRGGTGREPG